MKRALALLLCGLSLLTAAQDMHCPRVYTGKKGRGYAVSVLMEGEEKTVCYSEQGDFTRAKEHPLFRQFLTRCADGSPVNRRPALTEASLPDEVQPLLSDCWHQGAPYNLYSPLVDGEHCLTGCVAHAMAQVIRYHRYARGSGEHTYTDSLGCGQTLHTSFPMEGYDFDAMQDAYPEEGYDPNRLEPLAQLLYDCGVAVDMCYGLHSSSADAKLQPRALVEHFGYDIGVQQYYRDFYSYREWVNMLKTELAEGRPVLMTAASPSLSHALCCDGYDAQGLFHLNFGQGGDADGYYYLPYLTPLQPEWYDVDSPEGGMNLLQSATTGILPREDEKASGHPRPVLAMAAIRPITESAAADAMLTVCTENLGNIGWDKYEGDVSLALKAMNTSDESEPILLTPVSHAFHTDTTYTDTLSFTLPPDVPTGDFRLVPLFRSGATWKEVLASMGTPNYLLAHILSDGITLSEDVTHSASLSLQDFSFPDTVMQGDNPLFSLDFQNGRTEYCGRFYVILEPTGHPGDYRYIQYQGLYLQAGERATRYFHRTKVNLAAGDYYLKVCYDLNLFNDSVVWLSEVPLKTVHVRERLSGIRQVFATGLARFYDLQGRFIPHPESYRGVCVEMTGGQRRKRIK